MPPFGVRAVYLHCNGLTDLAKRVGVQVPPLFKGVGLLPSEGAKVASTTGIGWTLLARSVRPLHS